MRRFPADAARVDAVMKRMNLLRWIAVITTALFALVCGRATTAKEPLSYSLSGTTCGIRIKAPSAVDPEAITLAQQVIDEMLRGSREVRARLVARKAELAIIPRNAHLTALPEFAYLAGQKDRNGSDYDSFDVRGAGGIIPQPVTATSEENLLKLPGDRWAAESIAHHEFAHAVMNLGFSDAEIREWETLYAVASEGKFFPGAFAMTHAHEYWAELSQSWFSVNNEINGPAIIRERHPEAAVFLETIYGPPKTIEAPSPASKGSE